MADTVYRPHLISLQELIKTPDRHHLPCLKVPDEPHILVSGVFEQRRDRPVIVQNLQPDGQPVINIDDIQQHGAHDLTLFAPIVRHAKQVPPAGLYYRLHGSQRGAECIQRAFKLPGFGLDFRFQAGHFAQQGMQVGLLLALTP